MPTGGLDWITEEVITHQAGERKDKVYRELLRDQLGTQVVFLTVGDVPHPLISLCGSFPPASQHRTMMTVSEWSENPPFTNSEAVTVVPSGPFCQALGLSSENGFSPLPPSPLKWRFPREAKVTEGRVGFPLRDSYFGEAADAPSSYGSQPAAMAEGQRMDRFYVLGHVHFENFEYDLWPAGKLATHFTQGKFACLIQTPMNIMQWSFNLSQHRSTKTAQAPL